MADGLEGANRNRELQLPRDSRLAGSYKEIPLQLKQSYLQKSSRDKQGQEIA